MSNKRTQAIKELCANIDKEAQLPIGTNYRLYRRSIILSVVLIVTIVVVVAVSVMMNIGHFITP